MREEVFPTAEKPLVCTFLRHKMFRVNAQTWLQRIINVCKEHGIPHHAPRCTVVEAKGKTIAQMLFVHKATMTTVEQENRPECACTQFAEQIGKRGLSTTGHVCADLEDLLDRGSLTEPMKSLMGADANETFEPERG